MIITISGAPASGKSTVAVLLSELLKIERVYMGQVFRDLAAERGVTLTAFYDQLKDDPKLEMAVDANLAKRMLNAKALIAEGRVAFLWDSRPEGSRVDIFITVDPTEGARRHMQDMRSDEERFETKSECRAYLEQRVAMERERYRDLYDVDNHHDPRYFDFIPDSTDKTPERVRDEIVDFLRAEGLLAGL